VGRGLLQIEHRRDDRASGRIDALPSPLSSGFAGLIGTGPWQFVVHEDYYLYFTEFFDGDVVRLDEQAFAANPAACKALDPDGRNLCMSEIHAGRQLKELKLQGDRLYFAGYQTFGWINRSSWTPGVLYNGLETLRDPERRKWGELITGDLAVDPGGMVVLNDYSARAVYRLYPTQQ